MTQHNLPVTYVTLGARGRACLHPVTSLFQEMLLSAAHLWPERREISVNEIGILVESVSRVFGAERPCWEGENLKKEYLFSASFSPPSLRTRPDSLGLTPRTW